MKNLLKKIGLSIVAIVSIFGFVSMASAGANDLIIVQRSPDDTGANGHLVPYPSSGIGVLGLDGDNLLPLALTFGSGLNVNSGVITAVSPTRVFANTSRSIQTGTGAVGFQIDASRDAMVNYAVNISTTATIGSATAGYITLEIAPTNSATAGDWVEIGARCRNDQTITLAIALQSVQNIGCSFGGIIPAGYYAKIRSVTVSGSPTFSFVSSQEVKL